MASCQQPLSSLVIPSLDIQFNGLGNYKISEIPEEVSDALHANSKAFQNRFPPISHIQVQNSQRRKLPGNFSNLWSYGTPFLVKLLFSGHLPQTFFDELCSAVQDPVNRRRLWHRKETHVERNKELWEPKDFYRLREQGRHTDQRILQARLRHKERLLQTQNAKHEHSRERTEAVLLKKAGTMNTGMKSYLNKIELQAEKLRVLRKIKRAPPRDREASAKPASIFNLTDSTLCKTPDFSSNSKKKI